MATRARDYVYELKKYDGERTAVYKKIFNQFGHTGSLMEMRIFDKLSEEEKVELCNLVFMVNKDQSHLLFPMIRNEEVSSKEASVLSIYAMKHVTEHCSKFEVPASTFISLSENSGTAKVFGFEKIDVEENITGTTFYEFAKTQKQVQTPSEKTTSSKSTQKVEAPKVQ